MEQQQFRLRVIDAAARVAERTGVDPLDLDASIAVSRDSRLEQLPRSVGIGLGAMIVAIAVMCLQFALDPTREADDPTTVVFVVLDVILACGLLVCVGVARAAKARRPENERFDDAWARLAVELWPSAGVRALVAGARGRAGYAGGDYSRTQFLMAVAEGADLSAFTTHAPMLRLL